MTVGVAGEQPGQLLRVIKETSSENREVREVQLSHSGGKVFANLTMGADVASAKALMANSSLTSRGVMLFGSGFIVTSEEATSLGLGEVEGLEKIIREYRNGRDLTQKSRGAKVIDLFGLKASEVRDYYPAVYQWVRERVKPERDQNRDKSIRENWWLHGRPRPEWRSFAQGLSCYIATVETTKHRLFTSLSTDILPDNMLVNVAVDDPAVLGILSSRIHGAWALAAGGRLGIGNDPRYNKTRCFETFPFAELNDDQAAKVGALAKRIDDHRKSQQAAYGALTLTGMYNVLEKLRAGEELTDKDKTIHRQGLVSVLGELHDNLDCAVFEAYGWPDLADKLVGLPGATTPFPGKPADQAEAEEELLMRLVALNKQRTEEESRGIVRWLRPEYQSPTEVQTEVDMASKSTATKQVTATSKIKDTFPKAIPDQLRVLRAALAERPYTTERLAERFKRKPVKSVEEGLLSLAAVGVAEFDAETKTWQVI